MWPLECPQDISLTLSQTSPGFTCLQYKSFKATIAKREITHNEQFLLFQQCFLAVWRTVIFVKLKFIVCKLFQFGVVYHLLFG